MKMNYKKLEQLKDMDTNRINKLLGGISSPPYDGKKVKKDRKQGKEVIVSLEQN